MIYDYSNKRMSELFKVLISDHAEDYPFNMEFKALEKQNFIGFNCTGPGIYLIEYNNKIIYVGKFRPVDKSDILDIRWRKHLMTVTLRGKGVGFRKKPLKKIIEEILNEKLKNILLMKQKGELKDTGYMTSENRMRFASNNWSEFSSLTEENILNKFQVHYFRLCGFDKRRIEELGELEKDLINRINPKCNSQYKSGEPEPKESALKFTRNKIEEAFGNSN